MPARFKTNTKVARTILLVHGVGAFPFDMLRYDSCCPDTGADAALLEHHRREARTVRLRRYSASGNGAEVARWRSFGWEVVSEEAAP